MLYIVQRPFKSVGVFYDRGSIIEAPTNVRTIKSKVMGGKLLPVRELDRDTVTKIRHLEKRLSMSLMSDVQSKLLAQPVGGTLSGDLNVRKATNGDTKVVSVAKPVPKSTPTVRPVKKAKVVIK